MASNSSGNSNEFNFVNELDDELKCLICLGVARDPLQHEECGKLFCRKCLEQFDRDKPCPNCRMQKSHYYVDKRGKRTIEALKVKCHNVERRCEWEGTVGTIERHMVTCQFTLLPCPNQCKTLDEINTFMRKDLDGHLEKDCPNRDYECQYCGEKGTYTAITEIHDKICDKKIVSCPNTECNIIMQRQQVDGHIKSECSYTIVPCKYESIGCSKKMKRRDMTVHEQDDKVHLHMALETTLQLKSEVAELRRDLRSAINILQLTLQPQPQTYKLTDYQKKKEKDEIFTFPPFYTHPQRYHVAVRVDANGNSSRKGTHVSVFVVILKGEYDTELKWPLLGKVTFKLLNQLEDKNHHTMTLSLTTEKNVTIGKTWGFSNFIPHSALGHDPIKNTQYLKDDTLYFRMSVEGHNYNKLYRLA